MPWIYLNTPYIQTHQNSFMEAFDYFLKQCTINESFLAKLDAGNCFRFIIRTDGVNDKIVCSDGKIFLRSKFLENKNFKKMLIDYYKPLNIYIKGPNQIVRRDGNSMEKWIIELTPIYSYPYSTRSLTSAVSTTAVSTTAVSTNILN